MTGNRKRRHNINVSPCKHSCHSTVRRLEQPACCGWRWKLFSDESWVQTWATLLSFCLLCLQMAQVPREAYPAAVLSFISFPCLPVQEKESTGTQLPLPTIFFVLLFGRYGGQLLKADLYTRMRLSIILGHYFSLAPFTFWWLICDFWWITFPSVL